MQTVCTSLQTDDHTNTSSFSFYRPGAFPDAQPTVSKQWRETLKGKLLNLHVTIAHSFTPSKFHCKYPRSVSDSERQCSLYACLHNTDLCWGLPLVLWRCWLGGRKGTRPVKTEWWGAGMVIFLERGADLHMVQLMSLPLTVSCFSKIQIDFTFLVLAHPGSLGKRAVKRVCVICAEDIANTYSWLISV